MDTSKYRSSDSDRARAAMVSVDPAQQSSPQPAAVGARRRTGPCTVTETLIASDSKQRDRLGIGIGAIDSEQESAADSE